MKKTKLLLLAGTMLPVILAGPSFARDAGGSIVVAQDFGDGPGGDRKNRDRGDRPDRQERPDKAERGGDRPDRGADRPDRGADRPDRAQRDSDGGGDDRRQQRQQRQDDNGARKQRDDAGDRPERADKPDRKQRDQSPDAMPRSGSDERFAPKAPDATKPDRGSSDRPDRQKDRSNATVDKPDAIPSARDRAQDKGTPGGDQRQQDRPNATGDKPDKIPTARDRAQDNGAPGGDRMKDQSDQRQQDRPNAGGKPDTIPTARDRAQDKANPGDPRAGDQRIPDDRNRDARDPRSNDGDRNANDRNANDRGPNDRNPGDRNANDRFNNDRPDRAGDNRPDGGLRPGDDRRDRDRDASGTPDERRDRFEQRLRDDRRDVRDDRRDRNQTIDVLRGERRERRDGDTTIITEGDRTIYREGDRTFIRRDENLRFREGARDYREERDGDDYRTIVDRPDGSQVITITDRDGRLIRRTRRYQGEEYVLIDNRPRGGRSGVFIDLGLPPPRISIPREEYIVDADDASYDQIEEAFQAPPVERIDRSYSLDEIRQNAPLRERVRSVDLDTITFDTGSWDVRDDQIKKLENVGLAMEAAIKKNPRTVFMVEGYTDAVGAADDNLSLSDRRAQSVAEILTKYFTIPAENLTTQGYGEQFLKVKTDGPEERNRRVTIRNITQLLTSSN